MQLSQQRIEANRANTLQSTDPKTEEGKANSAQNPLQPGLTATSSALLPTECPLAYNTFIEEIRDDLNPNSARQSTKRRTAFAPACRPTTGWLSSPSLTFWMTFQHIQL